MDIIRQVASELESHGIESSRVNAEAMLSVILDCRRADLYLKDIKPDRSQLKLLGEMVRRRINGEPLQYITGKVNFYGNELLIRPGVFIPRPETEILVDNVLNLVTSDGRRTTDDEPLILDLCTGSGNIAISLTKALTRCKIIASDISEEAIALARENAGAHGVSDRIKFIKAGLFNLAEEYKFRFDAVVSNPPYLRQEELKLSSKEIKREPEQALDGGRDGMSFYSKIAEGSAQFLKSGAVICLELADGLSEKVKELFEGQGQFYDICIIKDLNGIDRVITAVRKKLKA